MNIDSGPVDFFGPTLLSGCHRDGGFTNSGLSGVPRASYRFSAPSHAVERFADSGLKECPGGFCESSSGMVVACMMAADKSAPETVVLQTEKVARFGGMCLWGINCAGNFVRLPGVFRPTLRGITCLRETHWDPGGVGTCRLAVCDDCFCLITLSRCILMYDPRRSCLPNMFLKNICNERTIEWEVVCVASVISPCCLCFSPCLDVSRIKRLLTDVFLGRVITALLWPGVGGREVVLGIIAPVGVTIQVMHPWGGGFAVQSVWLQLISHWE